MNVPASGGARIDLVGTLTPVPPPVDAVDGLLPVPVLGAADPALQRASTGALHPEPSTASDDPMGDDGHVRSHHPPVDPLIATRSSADHDAGSDLDDRGIPPGTGDATDGFGLFAAPPEPVAAWHRAPSPGRPTRPGLLVPAAVLATVAAIWAIAELRPAPTDPTAAATVADAPPEPAETVDVAVMRLGQRDGATVVELSVTTTGSTTAVLSNHVWVVRDGLAFPEATAAVACLATDDRPDKPLPAVSEVAAEAPVAAGAAHACGVGGFVLAPGAPARIDLTVGGLEPGDHRVVVSAGSSPVFTVP